MNIILTLSTLFTGMVGILFEKKMMKFHLIPFVITLALFALSISFRNMGIVPDAGVYESHYNYYKAIHTINFSLTSDLFGFATGFSLINQFFAYLNIDFKIFSAILAIINSLVMCYATSILIEQVPGDKEKYSWQILLMMYIGYYGIFYNAIAIRAGLSLSFVVLGYAYKSKNKYIKMGIAYVLAVSFHTSAIFFAITSILIDKIKINRTGKYITWWFIIFIIWILKSSKFFVYFLANCMIFASKIFPFLERYNYYIDKLYSGNVIDIFASKKNIMFLVLCLLFIFAQKLINSKKYDMLLNIYLVGLTILFSFNTISEIYRLADYFLIFMLPMLSVILNKNRIFSGFKSFVLLNILVLIQVVISLRITGIY